MSFTSSTPSVFSVSPKPSMTSVSSKPSMSSMSSMFSTIFVSSKAPVNRPDQLGYDAATSKGLKANTLECMKEIQHECFKMGIPLETRHREVTPGQFEFAPEYGNLIVSPSPTSSAQP